MKAFIESQGVFTIAGDSPYPISRHLLKAYFKTPTPRHEAFNFAQCGLRDILCLESTTDVVKPYSLPRSELQKGTRNMATLGHHDFFDINVPGFSLKF